MIPQSKVTIEKFKSGDSASFDAIYHLYSRKLFHFALGLLKDPDAAKEIVQDVFVKLWEKRTQVDLALNFDNYIFKITLNSIRKHFNDKSIERRALERLSDKTNGSIEDIDNEMIYGELLELANKSIEKMPSKRKIVYKLSRQEGMKIKEIASKLNISNRTVENHLAKSLKFLKEELVNISLVHLIFFYLFIK